MIVVLVMAAALWGIGAAMGAPRRQRAVMIGVLALFVAVVQLSLPAGHPLREATGTDIRLWLLIAAFVAGVWAYRRWLRGMRVRAGDAPRDTAPGQRDPLNGGELNRYARHIALREIGGPGQRALRAARVLVVGAGGLGSPVLQYLGAAGVGTIGVIDGDVVEAANLARQVIHTDASIGMPKVFSAQSTLMAQNPFLTVRPYHRRLTIEIAPELIAGYDLVLDGSDDPATRTMVNEVCVAAGVPLIGGAITQWEGQLSVWDPARGAPCRACVFPVTPDPALVPTCAEAGVAGPLPGMVGTAMAMEAVKIICDIGTSLRGRLMLWDALDAEMRVIAVRRRVDCEVCGSTADRLASGDVEGSVGA